MKGCSMGAFYTIAFIGGALGVAVATVIVMYESKKFLLQTLLSSSVTLQNNFLNVLIKMADGSISSSNLVGLVSPKDLKVLSVLIKNSFMYAFSNVMKLNLIIVFLILILSFCMKKNVSNNE